jgi:LSD1 subclass zinc finger protein
MHACALLLVQVMHLPGIGEKTWNARTHIAATTVQANRVAHLQCQGCRTWLMYAYGARSVKCAICESITRTDGGQQQANTSGMAGPSATAQPQLTVPVSAPTPEMPAVVVQNPPTVDEDGNEVCVRPLCLKVA